jgi:glycosyltransferase involved in cell wall biosynthesis
MKIWVYTIAYNEAHFVKNFLRAYKDAEKIIVYDNMSSDNTVTLLKEDKRVEIRTHDSGNEIRDDLYLQIKNNCWKEARGIADWVIIVDFDEVFTRAISPKTFDLHLQDAEDFDLIKPYGYNVFSENMPIGQDFNPLDSSLQAVYDKNSEKPCCFRPDKLAEINFNPGCHSANPVGINNNEIAIMNMREFKLVHFKYCNIQVYFNRLSQYKQRMSQYNLATGFGIHYTWSFQTHRDTFMKGLAEAKPIFEI